MWYRDTSFPYNNYLSCKAEPQPGRPRAIHSWPDSLKWLQVYHMRSHNSLRCSLQFPEKKEEWWGLFVWVVLNVVRAMELRGRNKVSARFRLLTENGHSIFSPAQHQHLSHQNSADRHQEKARIISISLTQRKFSSDCSASEKSFSALSRKRHRMHSNLLLHRLFRIRESLSKTRNHPQTKEVWKQTKSATARAKKKHNPALQ